MSKEENIIININKSKLSQLIDHLCIYHANITESRNSQHKPLDLLVLLILNQSTTDISADQAFINLQEYYNYDYHKMFANYDKNQIIKLIRICGLAPTKAEYIFILLDYLVSNHDLDRNMSYLDHLSDIEALHSLTKIKGIGIKSASCMLMFAKNRNIFPIDTHVSRIFRRIGIISNSTNIALLHDKIRDYFQISRSAFIVHVNLINLGRNICTRNPSCNQCTLLSICDQLI